MKGSTAEPGPDGGCTAPGPGSARGRSRAGEGGPKTAYRESRGTFSFQSLENTRRSFS